MDDLKKYIKCTTGVTDMRMVMNNQTLETFARRNYSLFHISSFYLASPVAPHFIPPDPTFSPQGPSTQAFLSVRPR